MSKKIAFVFWISFILLITFAKDPSTVISSNCMEMLRFHDHNEFIFEGNVQIRNVNFIGSGGRMWVYSVTHTHQLDSIGTRWFYLLQWNTKPFNWISYLNFNDKALDRSSMENFSQLGQIKLIIAWNNVQLETEDKVTGERKRSFSGKAVIYPISMKMELSENPSVYSSVQGSFRGGKITFYKNSGQIVVEDSRPGERSQVFLEE